MGFTSAAKAKAKSSSSGSTENWGMGLLLVFFPEDDNNNGNNKNTAIVDHQTNPSMSSSPFPSLQSSPSRIRRTNSSLLFTKAQSTISICALLVFLTLLLFTLSTFEPTIPSPATTSIKTPRRFLSQKSLTPNSQYRSPFFYFFKKFNSESYKNKRRNEASSFALQGMGTLYRRGTRNMPDLVVGHVVEDVKEDEFRLFLRVLHRSGLTAKADIAFLFGSSSSSSKFDSVIREENESFLKLVHHYKELNGTRKNSVLGFDVTQFVKSGKKEVGEPLWGKRIRGNYSNSTVGDDKQGELTQLNYGSMVSFDVTELDPENSLAGFLDHVPMSLRRWACYPMLLGRVRRNFKHIALVDVKHLLLLSDPLGRVRNKSPDSVHISMKQDSSSSSKHSKRISDKTQSHHSVNSAIIKGGARGVRRLSNAMLTEIVRATMQHKKKNSVTESGVLSQLVANEHVLKNINLITSTESIPVASSLSGSNSKASADCGVIQWSGNSNSNSNHDIDYFIIMKIICSCELDSSVYKNC